MKDPTGLVCIALFLAWLSAPGLAVLAGVPGGGGELENRATHPFPELRARKVWKGSWAAQFSDYVWDRIPFRGELTRLEHALSAEVFGDSPVPGTIIVGEGDFQYVRDRSLGSRGGYVDAERLFTAIDTIEAAFDAAQVPLVLVVSPTKAVAHPEFMPPEMRAVFDTTVQAVSDQLEDRARTDPHMLSMWPILRAEKERLRSAALPDERLRTLFRAHDLHWNVETGLLQARAIVDHLSPGRWDPRCAPRLEGAFVELDPELKKIYTKLGPTEPYQALRLSPEVQQGRRRLDPSTVELRTRSTCAPDPRALGVLRDSFLDSVESGPAAAQNGNVESIASFFAESRFLHWDAVIEEPEAANVLEGSEVVVIQVVQSNLGNLIGQQEALVALADRIGARRGPPAPAP